MKGSFWSQWNVGEAVKPNKHRHHVKEIVNKDYTNELIYPTYVLKTPYKSTENTFK